MQGGERTIGSLYRSLTSLAPDLRNGFVLDCGLVGDMAVFLSRNEGHLDTVARRSSKLLPSALTAASKASSSTTGVVTKMKKKNEEGKVHGFV